MHEEEFYHSEGIVISRSLARFGGTSYPISNISLVRVGYVKRANSIAIILGLIGAVMLIVAFYMPPSPGDQGVMIGFIGAGVLVVAFFCQAVWPKKVFTFVLKANSGDVETFTTDDHTLAGKVKEAIEEAIRPRT